MTEERLIKYLANRKSWVSYETLAKYFCVSTDAAQTAIKRLEREGHVQFKFGERGRKLWQLTGKPKEPAPDPVAVPAVRVHRIEDGESRAAPKPRPNAPTQPQSWFSVLGK